MNKTPYESLLGHKPRYDHMQVFFYLVYVKENEVVKYTFKEMRACMFIGYPYRHTWYWVFNLKEKKDVLSDVKFVECKFPYQEEKTNII